MELRAAQLHGDVVALSGGHGAGGKQPVVVQGDVCQLVLQQVVEAVGRHTVNGTVKVQGGGIGRTLIGEGIDQRSEGLVQRVLTEELAQGIEHHAALVVVDVALVLHTQQRQFALGLASAGTHVLVVLQLQELAHVGAAVFLLHHHQRTVLAHALAQQRAALHVGADHLVRPPLVPHLVGHHIEHHVDVALRAQVGDEADALAVGHGAREGLREAEVARELQDAHLSMAVGAEVLRVVGQRLLHAGDHARHVHAVLVVVVHLHVHGSATSRRGPLFAGHFVAGAQEAVEVLRGVVQRVLEVVAPVLGPLLAQGPGCDGDLVSGGADVRAHVHPVAVGHQVGVLPQGGVLAQRGHAFLGRQVVLAPVVAVAQFRAGVVADPRHQVSVVEEAAVVHQLDEGDAVLEALGGVAPAHGEGQLGPGRQGRVQPVDPVVEVLVVEDQLPARQVDLQVHIIRQEQVQ